MFLTDLEVCELTGYRQPSKQVAMLRKQGIPFFVNASGYPKVARAIIERSAPQGKPVKGWAPKWAGSQL